MEYIYLSGTMSICDKCLKQIPAKIVRSGDSVYLKKTCPEHGDFTAMLEESYEYYISKPKYDKPGTKPNPETRYNKGCPYDCGLCSQHEQHTCIGLIEITDCCDTHCPMCYAKSTKDGIHLDIKTIEAMADHFISAEGGAAEVLQISGGEPTTHPEILEILEMLKGKNIGHIMLNTNGKRIAEDPSFAERLQKFIGGFEIYLQFDSLKEEAYNTLRGRDTLKQKLAALKNLERYSIPVTLVATVVPGVNEEDLGDIIKFGLDNPCVRGINFQPAARFGGFEDAAFEPLTISGLLHRIENQTSSMIKAADFIPLPCNVDRVAVTYMYRKGADFIPLTRNRNIEKYVPYINNTFMFSVNDALSAGKTPVFGCKCLNFLQDFNKIIPKGFLKWDTEKRVKYLNENTFRITVTSFVDKHNFDLKSMQKECVHIITPDLKRIPFSAYNMIYRGSK